MIIISNRNRKEISLTRFFVVLVTLLFSIQITSIAQNGPGGVGNFDGSNGQPQNVMWFSAENLSLSDTDPVSLWSDLSGNGNDASQGIAASQPLYRTGEINGLPAIVFDGTDDFLPFDGSLITNSNYTVILVGARQTNSGFEAFLGGTTSSANQNLHIYWNGTSQFRAHHYGNDLQTNMVLTSEPYSDGTNIGEYGIFTTLLSSTDAANQRRNYQNNFLLGTRSNSAQLSSYLGSSFGRYNTGYYDVNAAEVIIFSDALNDAQLQVIYEYLGNKYGITIFNDLFNPTAGYNTNIIGIGEETNGEHSESNSSGLYLTALSGLTVGDYVFASHNNAPNGSSDFRTDAEVTASGVEEAYNRTWFIDTVGTPAAQIAFDFSEAVSDGLNPTEITNYQLLYRAGTSGNFSIVKSADGIKNGDQVYFDLTDVELNTGYYTFATSDSIDSPLEGVAGRTWYTLISGNWDDWEVWTLDPSGSLPNNPDKYTPSTSPTNTADDVVILTGRTVTDTSDNLSHNSIIIDGRLDLTTSTGHSFGVIRGTGRVLMAADNFPSGDASHFYTKGQGEGTVVYYGNSYDLSTAREFYDMEIELDGTADSVILLNDYTINGNLTITSGNLKINDDTDDQLINLSVAGDVEVSANTGITVGTGNPFATAGYTIGGTMPAIYHDIYHQFVMEGDFTNNGVVRLTNLDAPDYNSFATNGGVTVRLEGASNSEINLYNTTDFYNLVVDKGTDKTYKANVYSDNIAYFRLFGANNVGRTTGAPFSGEDPQIRKALFIHHGTLQLRGNIYIPTLSEGSTSGGNGDYAVGKNARLWMDGSNVTVYSTASDVDQITGFTSGDTYTADGVQTNSSNQAMSVFGEFKISDGTFGTRNSAGFIFWAAANAQVKIEGGTCNVAQMRSSGSGGGIASYTQTGGVVNVFGNEGPNGGEYTGAYPLFGLEGTDAVFQMSGGEIILRDEDGDSDPEWSIESAEGNYLVTGGKVTINVRDTRSVQVLSTANFWDLEITNSSGSGNMTVELDTTLDVDNDLFLDNFCTLEVTDPTTFVIQDISVGRNFSIIEGATYNFQTNTTSFDGTEDGELYIGYNTDDGYEQHFNNFVVNKPAGNQLLVVGDPNKSPSVVTNDWHNRLVHIENDLSIISGTLNQGDQSVRLYGGVYVSSAGVLGVYIDGTTERTAYIMLKDDGTSGTDIITETGAEFGNLKLNPGNGNTVSISSDVHVKRIGFHSGSMDIGTNNLKVDYLHRNATQNNFRSNNGNVNKMIFSDGNASDGGLSILINQNATYGFPLGVSGKYTPAEAIVTSFSDDGYVTIKPVNHYLWTISSGNTNVLDYYWSIDYEDFGANPDVYLTFDYDSGDVDGNDNSYRAARVINYTTIESLGNGSVDNSVNEIYYENGTLTAGDYTAGNPSAFNSAVRVLYARKNGEWHDFTTWSTTPDGNTPLNNKNQLPEPGDIVVIGESNINGDANQNYAVAVCSTHADYAPIDIAMLSILRYGGGESSLVTVGQNGADCNFGFVTNRDPDAADPESTADHASKIIISGPDIPSGDFGDFLTAENTLWTYSRAFPGSNSNIDDDDGGNLATTYYGSYKIGSSITEYPILQFEYDGYSGGYIELPDADITVHNDLRMFKDDHHLIFANGANGNLTVEGDFEFNSGGTFEIEFQATGTARTLTVEGDINFNNEPTSEFLVENAASTLVHKIELHGDVINPSASSSFNCYNGTGNASADLEFAGESNSVLANMTTIPEFNQLIMNKGTDQTYTATINSNISLGSPANSTSGLKPVQLLNGTLVFNNSALDLDISTGDEDFKIPSTACLQLTQGIANVSGDDAGILLDGKLLIDGGTLDMISGAGNGNNYIEYSASGNAEIEISSGNLWVGSQLRRSLITEEGILSFTQSGGEVQLGVNDGGDDERGIFEILNTGSSFTHSNGDFYLVNDYRGGASIASMYFNPETVNLSANTVIQFGHTSTTTGNGNFTLYAGKDLNNIAINSTNSPSLTLDIVPLTLAEDLTINTDAEFDANGLDLNINGDLFNYETFTANSNNTYFLGSGAQQITGNTTFWNLHKTTANSLILNDDIEVNNELHLEAGSLNDGDNTLSVQGYVWMDISHTWGGTSNGILLNGSEEQVLTGSGTFGKLSINNSSGVSLPEGSVIKIDEALQLESGVLDIGKNLLILNESAIVIEENAFSESNMIQTNISFTDAGVKKFFPAIIPSDNYNFIFPIGSEGKYTPVEMAIDSIAAGGDIRVKGANEIHPTIVNDAEPCNELVDSLNVLKYHWLMEATNVAGFVADVNMEFYPEDYQLNSADYDVTHYIAARLLFGSTLWNKYDPASFDETNSLLRFNFSNSDDNGISGDYTAGIEDQAGLCEGAIPDEVPAYITIADGDWTDETIWDTYPTAGGTVPSGGPRGAIAIIEHTVDIPSNYILNYKTTIDNPGVLRVGTTFGHRLGIVEGDGTLQLETGSMPAGIYDDFFSQTGGTIEFTGTGSYDVLSEVTTVKNLKFTGTGERRLPNLDFEVYGLLTIAGDDATLEVINEHDRNVTLDSNVVFTQGSFDAGVGTSTVIFNGDDNQTIAGDFSGTNAFWNIEMNNTSGVTLAGDIDVDNVLNFSAGIITTSATDILTINNSSETAAVTGYGASNFVNGPMRKLINSGDAFIFPVGDDSRYGQVEVTNTATLSVDYWEVEYFNANPHASMDTSLHEAGLEMISGNEYWRIEGPAGDSAKINMTWNSLSLLPAMTTDRVNNMKIVEWDGAEWVVVDGTVSDGGINSGSILSDYRVDLDEHFFTFGTYEAAPLPTAGFLTLDTAICAGSTITLRAAVTSEPNYSISVYDGTTTTVYSNTTSPITFDVTPAITTTYTITQVTEDTDGTPISSTTTIFGDPVTVTILPDPTVNATNDGPVCVGADVNLTENGGDAVSWLWTSDGAATFDNSGIATPVASGAVDGEIFTVEITDASGCSNSTTTTVSTITCNNPPVLDPIGDTIVCGGEDLIFTVTATDPDGDGLTFSLDATSIATGMTINGSTGEFNWLSVSNSTTLQINHTVVITVTDDGSPLMDDSETITITQYRTPETGPSYHIENSWAN